MDRPLVALDGCQRAKFPVPGQHALMTGGVPPVFFSVGAKRRPVLD